MILKYYDFIRESNAEEDTFPLEILEILEKHSLDIDKFSYSSCRLLLTLKAERTERPNYDFLEEINNLDVIYNNNNMPYTQRSFRMGKAAENCSYYQITLYTKYKKGVNINTQYLPGIALDFLVKNNINNIQEFVELTIPIVVDLNRYIKISKKKELYAIKSSYIKFLYKNKFIKNIKRHNGQNGTLYLFETTIPNTEENKRTDFITFHSIKMPDYVTEDVNKMEWIDGVFEPKKYELDQIDINRIQDNIKLLQNINQIHIQITMSNYFENK